MRGQLARLDQGMPRLLLHRVELLRQMRDGAYVDDDAVDDADALLAIDELSIC